MAYKKSVDDMRESPSLKLMELLENRCAWVDYFDPYIPEIPKTRAPRIYRPHLCRL
jgi:UDP-N-acetyl-D-glucosamine dehydrogenase